MSQCKDWLLSHSLQMAWMEMEVTSERLDLLSILLLVLLSPIVLMSRRLKDKNSRFFSVLAMSRILIALILSTVFFLDWNQCHRSLDPLLLSLAFFYSAILLTITRSKGLTVCPAVWLFVCGCIVASLIRWTSLLHEEQVMKELLVTTLLLILLILCSIVDSDLIQEKDKRLRGRESASFPSRMTFHWVTGLVVTACRKQLTLSDLHPLPDTDTCQYIREHVVDRFDGSRSLSLFLLQSFKWEIVHQAVYRMIAAASQLTVCVLLRQLVLFLLDSQSERMDGLRISLMMGIVSLVSNFAQHTHMDMSARTGLRMRTTVSCLMFRKTRTVGPTPDSQTQLLLSVDAESLPPLAEHGHVLWAFFVDLMVCGYFLWQELRVPGIAGLVLLVMTLPVHILVSGRIKYWQAEQMRHKDQRIRRTEDFVKGIQVVKMHAWEPGFQQLLQKVRQKELSFVRKTGYFLTLPAVTSSVLPLIASLVSFSLFVLNGHALSPDRVFFCLSLFNYMRISLNIMPRFVGLAVAARVALSRIQSFLSSPDRQSYVSILDSPDVVVRMTDALLTWNSSRDFCLHIRELVVRTGTLVAITGPVASGKSSLLSAILQDMSLESGLIQVSSMVKSTAFVSQRPWIRSQSIRENILFGQEYEKKKLLRVLRDCQLDQEVERMAGGDMTHVGENGSNLSGGQKQRLTIARACYAHPDLLLMDDPFSAVDPEVGRRVFHNLFDPKTGCLRHTTCIIVSNDPLILKRADQVVLMSGGQIRASGGYEDLCRSFPELTNEWSEKRTAESPPVHGFKENNHQSEEDTAKQAQQKPSAEKNMRFWHRIKNHPMVRYSHYLPFAWLLPILFLISQALDVGSGYYITLWSQETGSRVQDGLILLSVLSLGSVVTLILGSILTAGATVAAARELHDSLMHRLMRQCMSFFRKTPVGQIMSRFGSDMQCLDNGMVTSLVNLLSFTSQAISISAIVLMAVPSYAPVLLILLLLLILVYVYAMTGERQTTRMQSSTRCRVYSLFSELLSGRTTVRTFPASDSLFRRSMDDALEQNLCSIVSHQSLMRWRALRMDLLANVTIAAAAVAAVVAKSSVSDQRHVLLIAVSALYAIKLPITLNLIIRGFSEIEGHAVAVDRVLDFATKDTEEQQVSHKSVPKNWATKRPEVVVSHLSVKYASSDHAVLQDVSLHIRGGEKVAIVGRTGGGKSTIVASLFRLMSPEDEMTGSIWIQGQEIRDVALTDLRSRLSVMTQDPLVFHESVRFNLDPMDQRTDQQVWQALHDVCLSCTVSRLERHLHHRLTDEDLSHGQRQLLSLARVLVRRPNGLLVLDEATSALDSETESRILRTIRLMEDATVILIAHRLQTVIQFADRVLVLKDGRIVESGPPHDLLADTQSAFYALFHD